jgi:Tfp pilus assembly protein PilN
MTTPPCDSSSTPQDPGVTAVDAPAVELAPAPSGGPAHMPPTFPVLLAPSGRFPKVNLLPPEVEERRTLRRLQAACAAALVMSTAAVGGLYYMDHGKVATAQTNLDQAQAETARLQGETNKYSYVTETQRALDEAQTTLRLTLGNEIQWSQHLHDISVVIPDDVWLTTLNATQNVDGGSNTANTGGSAAQTPNTGAQPGSLGTVTMEGGALTWNAVAGWLDTLGKVKGFSNPWLTSSTVADAGGHPYIKYSLSVQVTAEALSNRYTQTGG